MGRKTFESLDGPLRNRTIVVITRNTEYSPEGVLIANSLSEAIELAAGEKEVFIAGGAEIYSEALTLAHCMYLTMIHQEFEGDTYFPAFDESDWDLKERRDFDSDDENPYSYSFLTYERTAQ
jgi:dihydrofolate reductase